MSDEELAAAKVVEQLASMLVIAFAWLLREVLDVPWWAIFAGFGTVLVYRFVQFLRAEP